MIYVNKIQNRIKFKIKIGYYLKLLMLETIKLIGSTKSKITESDSENVLDLEISEVILVHRNIAINNYQQNSIIVLYTHIPINILLNC